MVKELVVAMSNFGPAVAYMVKNVLALPHLPQVTSDTNLIVVHCNFHSFLCALSITHLEVANCMH